MDLKLEAIGKQIEADAEIISKALGQHVLEEADRAFKSSDLLLNTALAGMEIQRRSDEANNAQIVE